MALATTLTVLSIATPVTRPVKDVVEVAQQIRDAFKQVRELVTFGTITNRVSVFRAVQVPENYRKAREISEDILRFAEDIKLLYEEEKDVFEQKPRFKKLLEDLLRYV